MGLIKFTRMTRGDDELTRFGQFEMRATRQGLVVDGRMTVAAAAHGDKELTVIAEEADWAWERHLAKRDQRRRPDGDDLGLVRGAGVHAKAGAYCAYRRTGLVIKITDRDTIIEASGLLVDNATAQAEWRMVLDSLVADRYEVMAQAAVARRQA